MASSSSGWSATGILTTAASGIVAVAAACKAAATVGAMATAVGKLASAAAGLSALGSIPLLGGGARIGAPNAQERRRGLIGDIGDWWRGDDNPADQDDSPAPPDSDAWRKVSPGLDRWRPSSFLPQPGSAAPGGPSSGSGARTANVTGNDFHINVAGSNASAADLARALGDELQGLMNSQFSDGAVT